MPWKSSMLLALLGVSLSIPSCVTGRVELEPQGIDVAIVRVKPVKNCRYLGKIIGEGGGEKFPTAQLSARNDLRNKAGKRMADTVYLHHGQWQPTNPFRKEHHEKVIGSAYDCENKPESKPFEVDLSLPYWELDEPTL